MLHEAPAATAIARPNSRAEILHFLWRLGDREGEGVDMMRFDRDGLIEDYTVMVRPLSAVLAPRDAAFSVLRR